MELIQQLVSKLGIQEEQAKGGAGLLFKLAKEKLDTNSFSQIAGAVPDVDNLIGSAPESGGLMNALGGITSALGGKAEGLGQVAGLASGFSKLDLDSGMVTKFVPVVLSFVQSQGGDKIKGLLESVLSSKD